MTGLLHLNLIHFLDFYFMLLFFVGTYRRFRQYSEIGRFVLATPRRWPKVLKLASEHRMIFLTWGTVLPALLALGLMLAQLVASRFLWPEAGRPPEGLTVDRLLDHVPALAVVVPLGIAMVAFDIYSLFLVGNFQRAEVEKNLDQAEYWLGSHAAHVVRVATFGYVDPRRMVAEEVRKALVAVSGLLNYTLWWVTIQVGLRISFGLSLWLTWALTRGAADLGYALPALALQ
jgi:hypothetical protein